MNLSGGGMKFIALHCLATACLFGISFGMSDATPDDTTSGNRATAELPGYLSDTGLYAPVRRRSSARRTCLSRPSTRYGLMARSNAAGCTCPPAPRSMRQILTPGFFHGERGCVKNSPTVGPSKPASSNVCETVRGDTPLMFGMPTAATRCWRRPTASRHFPFKPPPVDGSPFRP